MKLNPSSLNNLAEFANYPNKYVLQARNTKEGVTVGLMKKGPLTWVKIHVGGLFGKFDRTSVNMRNIANLLFSMEEPKIETYDKFKVSFIEKAKHFEKKHTRLFIPAKGTFLNAEFSKLVENANLYEIEGEILARIKRVCPGVISMIHAYPSADGIRIKLTPSRKFSKTLSAEPSVLEGHEILNSLLKNPLDCSSSVKNIFGWGYKKIYIDLSLDPINKNFTNALLFVE